MYLVRFLEEVIADGLVSIGLGERVERRHGRVRSTTSRWKSRGELLRCRCASPGTSSVADSTSERRDLKRADAEEGREAVPSLVLRPISQLALSSQLTSAYQPTACAEMDTLQSVLPGLPTLDSLRTLPSHNSASLGPACIAKGPCSVAESCT